MRLAVEGHLEDARLLGGQRGEVEDAARARVRADDVREEVDRMEARGLQPKVTCPGKVKVEKGAVKPAEAVARMANVRA